MSNHYGGSDSFTVQNALNIMDDHIIAIEDINTNGSLSRFVSISAVQADIRWERVIRSIPLTTDPPKSAFLVISIAAIFLHAS